MAGHWSGDDLRRFLEVRQEFFLDPMGSNKARFLEAAQLLQQALFDWYTQPSRTFAGMLSFVTAHAETWSQMRKEERRTLMQRRFALNNAVPDTPAVESSVSENQWQRIFGSLGLGLGDPGTFDRFLVQLDEETNPSLRINHRYLGELLPHDNMISYLSSMLATFLNENAIIGKASPCVTHMEMAAVRWLLNLVGWDGQFRINGQATQIPLQRLPIAPSPNQHFQRWDAEEPTGAIVAGGTIANISALLVARNAVFDYLLGLQGAVQTLGPGVAWEAIQKAWGYRRMVVLTSLGTHYSVKKAALQAGIPPANVIEIAGSQNPWVLDVGAFRAKIETLQPSDLVVAVVLIAGKTETGYVDEIGAIANALDAYAEQDESSRTLPAYHTIAPRLQEHWDAICGLIQANLLDSEKALQQITTLRQANAAAKSTATLYADLALGGQNEVVGSRHNRLFLHVDAAHGGGYLTVPELRHSVFSGIEHADTITIDGHKSFYCYYPCGGVLIRTTRWAQTLTTGHSDYISEETNYEAYPETAAVFERLRGEQKQFEQGKLRPLNLQIRQRHLDEIAAWHSLARRSLGESRSELTHQPFNQYLEGSRGAQGIMQLYFNLATLGLRGYQSILEWTCLLRSRCEEAISLGMSDLRPVTDLPLPASLYATDKSWAIATATLQPEDIGRDVPEAVVPIAGGRFLRLSAGNCNQVLLTYIPAHEAKLIVSADTQYWSEEIGGQSRIRTTMEYLWRVNEQLWNEHVYANPNFTYYVGHTALEMKLPYALVKDDDEPRKKEFVKMLAAWNAWSRWPEARETGFFRALAEAVKADEPVQKRKNEPENSHSRKRVQSVLKFFCHKIILMHPFTDESLVGDMLRRMAFWGEISVRDVRTADAAAKVLRGLQ
ncbi:MAG: hypothetical protein JO197_22905 [Acidobacteria bacterium]|nr:hypothetical protein [Acidobacteriota bacterium]MBV9477944.1 hypothetical protein [Acidobacteriota bacterium]